MYRQNAVADYSVKSTAGEITVILYEILLDELPLLRGAVAFVISICVCYTWVWNHGRTPIDMLELID